ncbi:MAG: hypothetical protein MJ252_17940 [archaeon]|nr:hypothetical protein [archaeon]
MFGNNYQNTNQNTFNNNRAGSTSHSIFAIGNQGQNQTNPFLSNNKNQPNSFMQNQNNQPNSFMQNQNNQFGQNNQNQFGQNQNQGNNNTFFNQNNQNNQNQFGQNNNQNSNPFGQNNNQNQFNQNQNNNQFGQNNQNQFGQNNQNQFGQNNQNQNQFGQINQNQFNSGNNIFNQNQNNNQMNNNFNNNPNKIRDLQNIELVMRNIYGSHTPDCPQNQMKFMFYDLKPLLPNQQPYNIQNCCQKNSVDPATGKVVPNDYNIWISADRNNPNNMKYCPVQLSSIESFQTRAQQGTIRALTEAEKKVQCSKNYQDLKDNTMDVSVANIKKLKDNMNVIYADMAQLCLNNARIAALLGRGSQNMESAQQFERSIRELGTVLRPDHPIIKNMEEINKCPAYNDRAGALEDRGPPIVMNPEVLDRASKIKDLEVGIFMRCRGRTAWTGLLTEDLDSLKNNGTLKVNPVYN